MKYETIMGGEFLAPHYSEEEQVAWRVYVEMSSACSDPVLRAKTVMAIRDAKARGHYDMCMEALTMRRRQRLTTAIVTQRRWQSKVSRRPQRGRHHDSWAIREKYVTCRDA